MRLLAAADIHGNLAVYDWLANAVVGLQAETLVLAGDLLSGGSEQEQWRVSRRIISLLQRVPVPVLYLMGNDDWISLDYEDEQVRPLHGKRLVFGGYGFAGYQYSLPFVGGIHEKPEHEIEKDLRPLEALLDERTVFVTHSPAFGTLDRVYGGGHAGSRSLAALLDRKHVLAHIHGHIHESFGRQGRHFNVASAGVRRAVLIELPALNHQVCSGDSWRERRSWA